jgi:hypothetical protein
MHLRCENEPCIKMQPFFLFSVLLLFLFWSLTAELLRAFPLLDLFQGS